MKKTRKEAKKASMAKKKHKPKAVHAVKKVAEKAMKEEKTGEAKVQKKGEKAKEVKLPAKALPKASREEQMSAYEILRYPLITEKAVNMIESENKLVFVVGGNATKSDVKKAVENLYGVKVDKVNIVRDMKARKRAIVKIAEGYKADDIATRLGVL